MSKFIGTSKIHFDIMEKAGVILPPFYVSDSLDHATLFAYGACNNEKASKQIVTLQKRIACLQRKARFKLICRKAARNIMRLDPFYGSGRLITCDSEDKFVDSVYTFHQFTPFNFLKFENRFIQDHPLILEVPNNHFFEERSSLDDFFGKYISETTNLINCEHTEDGLFLTSSIINTIDLLDEIKLNSDFLKSIKHNEQEGAEKFWHSIINY